MGERHANRKCGKQRTQGHQNAGNQNASLRGNLFGIHHDVEGNCVIGYSSAVCVALVSPGVVSFCVITHRFMSWVD